MTRLRTSLVAIVAVVLCIAPLALLRLQPETELCLGLVHYTDGVVGTRRRLATAEKHVQNFSIATECGFGRRAPDTIPELLRIHAEVAG